MMFPKFPTETRTRPLGHRLFKALNTIRLDEKGAVTVDWVVLTAAIVGLAFLSYFQIEEANDTVLTASGETVLTARDYLTP